MKPIVLYRSGKEWDLEKNHAEKYFECIQRRTQVPEKSLVISRFSALPFYKELEDDLKHNGSRLINSYQEHLYIADLKNWYYDLEGLTPRTWFRTQDIPENGKFILKGETNSKKFLWNSHMFANSKKEAIDVEGRLYNDSLISQQSIVIREFIELETFLHSFNGLPITREFRFFCYKNHILSGGYYWSSHTEELLEMGIDLNPDQVPKAFLEKIVSIVLKETNAFVIDVAKTTSGEWIVIELNDLQMSGLSDNDPEVLFKNLSNVI